MQIFSNSRINGGWPLYPPTGFMPPPTPDMYSPGYSTYPPPPTPFFPQAAPGWVPQPAWAPGAFPMARQTFGDPLLYEAPMPAWALAAGMPGQTWSTTPLPPTMPQLPFHVAPPIDFKPPAPSFATPPSSTDWPAAHSPSESKEEATADKPDHSKSIRSLERMEELASKAAYSASDVASDFADARSGAVADEAGDAGWSLRSAESDDENTDSSRAGREAEGKLDSIVSRLGRIDSASGNVSSITSAVSSIRSELQGLDRGQLSSGQISSLQLALAQAERYLSSVDRAASKVDDSVSDARYTAKQAASYAGEVAGDRDGLDVSRAAQSARSKADSLQSRLQSLAGEARSGEADADSLKSSLGEIASDAGALIRELKWS